VQREPLVFVGTCDLAGLVRGKGFPAADLPARLRDGVGLTHSNIMMSAFGPIYVTPFGTEGDLVLIPDPSTKVEVEFGDGAAERFYLADINTLDGKHWECCPRDFLRRALAALESETALALLAAFEQEFVYTGVEDRPGATYALDAWRRQGDFGEAYMAALRAAGLKPDSFLPEYGARQYEVTLHPSRGLRVADEAVIVREMAKAVSFRLGHRVILSPIVNLDGVGNGTHIHFSLQDIDGRPAMHDALRPYGLSEVAEPFVAGILHHLPAIAALTAPSIVSYFRLRPNRWAPVWANLAERDRGASLRVCAVINAAVEDAAHQFNVEYRVSDATASPYMALGAIVHAGVDGIRKRMKLAAPPLRTIWDMTEEQRRECNIATLPRSLGQALDALTADKTVCGWLGPELLDAYVRLKRSEIAAVEGHSQEAICSRYAAIY